MHIPQFHRMLIITAGNCVAIGAEADRPDEIGVSLQGFNVLTGIPDLCRSQRYRFENPDEPSVPLTLISLSYNYCSISAIRSGSSKK